MLVECWLWRYRDPLTGEVRTTQSPMDADEVGRSRTQNAFVGPRHTGLKMRTRLRRFLRCSELCLIEQLRSTSSRCIARALTDLTAEP